MLPKNAAVRLLPIIFVVLLLVSSCQSPPSLVGRWQAAAPSSLLYEFSDDGVVYLLDGDDTYQVFRYKFTSEDTIELYDGMGRIRSFMIDVSEDTMTLIGIDSARQMEVYQRVFDTSQLGDGINPAPTNLSAAERSVC